MPLSVIFEYIDREGNEKLAIGSHAYMRQKVKGCRQLICVLGIQQTDQERHYVTTLNEQQLYNALRGFMKKNELCIYMPN